MDGRNPIMKKILNYKFQNKTNKTLRSLKTSFSKNEHMHMNVTNEFLQPNSLSCTGTTRCKTQTNTRMKLLMHEWQVIADCNPSLRLGIG